MWPSITNNSVFRYHIRLIIFIHTAVKSAMGLNKPISRTTYLNDAISQDRKFRYTFSF